MKEIQVNGVFSAPGLTEDMVNDAIVHLAESREWVFGGGVQGITVDNAKEEYYKAMEQKSASYWKQGGSTEIMENNI